MDRLVLACTYAYDTVTLREYLEGMLLTGLASLVRVRRWMGWMIRAGSSTGGGPPLSAAQVTSR